MNASVLRQLANCCKMHCLLGAWSKRAHDSASELIVASDYLPFAAFVSMLPASWQVRACTGDTDLCSLHMRRTALYDLLRASKVQ